MKTKNQELLLEERPFSFLVTKDGEAFISWRGALKKRLTGNDARKFIDRIAPSSEEEAQLLMARATGNFKRGNERSASG